MIVKEYNIFEKGINAIVVTVGLLLCIWTATTMKATVATAIGLIPFLLTFYFLSASKRPTILLCITFYYQLYYNGNQPILSDSDSHHQYLSTYYSALC
mgnify:CR=1 FL=1